MLKFVQEPLCLYFNINCSAGLTLMEPYALEIGESQLVAICHCCGQHSYNAHGFIYKNDVAYAVYYAAWSDLHEHKNVTLALCIGEWGEASSSAERSCFGLDAFAHVQQIELRFIEPDQSPWPTTELLGNMLKRSESLAHPLLSEVLSLVKLILQNHAALAEYMA